MCSELCIIVGWDFDKHDLILYKANTQSVKIIASEWGQHL